MHNLKFTEHIKNLNILSKKSNQRKSNLSRRLGERNKFHTTRGKCKEKVVELIK